MENTHEITCSVLGRTRGYNREAERVRVEVAMFAANVERPRMIRQIEAMIDALYPNDPSSPGYYSRRGELESLGTVRIDMRPWAPKPSIVHEWHVAAWEFDYVTHGCD